MWNMSKLAYWTASNMNLLQNIVKLLSGNNYINSKKKLFGHRELFGLMLVLVRMKLVSLDQD